MTLSLFVLLLELVALPLALIKKFRTNNQVDKMKSIMCLKARPAFPMLDRGFRRSTGSMTRSQRVISKLATRLGRSFVNTTSFDRYIEMTVTKNWPKLFSKLGI